MLTPAEIRDKRFDKSVGGYKTEDVHAFLAQVAEYVGQLEEENAEIQQKIEVLADRLEQYKEDEESLRAALIGAQKLGQSVVRESQQKAEAIIEQAVKKSEDLVRDAQQSIDREAIALKRMQRGVASFREQIIKLYTEHLEMLKDFPEVDELPEVEMAKLDYTPPTPESMGLGAGVGESQGDLDMGEDFAYAAAASEAPENRQQAMDDDEDEIFPKRGKSRFGQLDQFFGEDKPIERQ